MLRKFSSIKWRLSLLLCLYFASAPLAAQTPPAGDCPQPRFTGKAPTEYLARNNPVAVAPDTLAAGERLFSGKSQALPCAYCHGVKGDGKGYLATQYEPRPRNFACKETITGVPDGQLFWIIRYGSPDTAMPPSKNLTDEQVWQLIHYVRTLAR